MQREKEFEDNKFLDDGAGVLNCLLRFLVANVW